MKAYTKGLVMTGTHICRGHDVTHLWGWGEFLAQSCMALRGNPGIILYLNILLCGSFHFPNCSHQKCQGQKANAEDDGKQDTGEWIM